MASSKDVSYWNLDYSDIMDIFKNNLKIENTLRSVQSIFLNKRFSSKIDFKPYFQRNYVWDGDKATYFIESILLGTEIPPLVLFKGTSDPSSKNEVIDGRQRYETLLRFLENEFSLHDSGLHRLTYFSGQRYVDFDSDIIDSFTNTKLRILQCSVTNEPSLTTEKEDKIKKEIFKRYNSGITPLKREENARAEYIKDPITIALTSYFHNTPSVLKMAEELFLSKNKLGLPQRDRINILLDRFRTILTLTKIPIYNYAKSSRRYDIIRKFYGLEITHLDPQIIVNQFVSFLEILTEIKSKLHPGHIYNNTLLYESLCWAFFIATEEGKEISSVDTSEIAEDLVNATNIECFWFEIINAVKSPEAIFEQTGSHYRNATFDRHRFIANYFEDKFQISFETHMKNNSRFAQVMGKVSPSNQLQNMKLIKPDPVSVTIDDILTEMEQSKFLVRPTYQRSEVKNIPKSSYLLESIMLGITIPPVYIYRREDKVKEVIDGQQRILTLLGFLGKTYLDENGDQQISNKHKFRLSGLKILRELNGLNVDEIQEKYPQYIDNILDFSLNIVEIDAAQNPEFNSIDLFLRLNTKPYPIAPNSFEMWNAYVAQSVTQKIKSIASKYESKIFRSKDTRMSNEELITALAYLYYQKHYRSAQYEDLLTVYLRNNHICGRISSKDRITKMLEDLTPQSLVEFDNSIDMVAIFVKKLCLLVGEDGKQFPSLVGTSYKTDQNFYFLWVILEDVSLECIQSNHETIFKRIKDIFSTISTAPDGINVSVFFKELSSLKW